ncbi:2Fe-2S iron-sulfur cluster-binding protein [Ramlibacter algicola]|uniref:2Fe-2S iron-sulfur cluster binding domain-containing protein n=1 Tax=Ramlibacter algicola TaxID=2795217 RepID=A0A934Q127_9BURK|nr:2Fe-2S iron-sulfur cluster-binding protein [Ramlibacter algicola]MBK0394235.1 2Fe-2S iron-sulfur cluster binding domain-containing protein [Ramlibacter algicola]
MDDDHASGGPHHWQVREGGTVFEAREGEPVLLAAERAGLPWPSSCRNGTCRTCLRRLVTGQVAYPMDWPGVLAEERRAGWFLPCVARARTDLVVADGAAPHELPVT